MTSSELVGLIDQSVLLLQQNKSLATPEVLNVASGVLTQAKAVKQEISQLFGIPSGQLDACFTAADTMLQMENTLGGNYCGQLETALLKLQSRPLLLALIAERL